MLGGYTIKKSLENYLENPKKDSYARWVEEQKYAFQTSTFNFNPTSDKKDAIHLKNARTLKPEILKDIVKRFKAINDLTVVFTDFIAEDIRKIENSREFKKVKDQGYFKSNFKGSDEVKIEVSDEEAKSLALGMTVYLCNKIENQDIDILKQYLLNIKQHGVDLNNSDIFGVTLLTSAAEQGGTEVVKVLLEAGVDVDKANFKGLSSLMFAAYGGHAEVVKILLEEGADVDKANSESVFPLMLAAQERHTEVVKTLLEAGTSVTPNTIKYIKKANIDIDIPAKDGSTLLLRAVKNNQTDITEVLLEAGADPNKANSKDGTTPLQAAMSTKSKDIILLITKYASEEQSITNTPAAVPDMYSKSNSKSMGISK